MSNECLLFLDFSPLPQWRNYLQLPGVSTIESLPQPTETASASAAINSSGSQLPPPGVAPPQQIVNTSLHDWGGPEFLAPLESVSRVRYEQFVEPTSSKLLYFFIQQPQAPPEQEPGIIIRTPVTREKTFSSFN